MADDAQAGKKLGNELAKVAEAHNLKAFRDKDKIIFVIQDAPQELRRLADALDKINVKEIQALVAFKADDAGEREVKKKK